MAEDRDDLDEVEADLIRRLTQILERHGVSVDSTKRTGVDRLHVPFRYGDAALGVAVILVGMVPSRWLVAITGKTIHDPPVDHEISWLRPAIESAAAEVCGSAVRWYSSLEDVPMAWNGESCGEPCDEPKSR